MYSKNLKIGSLFISLIMFLYWGVVVAQSATIGVGRGVNHCGDGVLRVDLGEVCDDGNYIDGDGCSANCEDESVVAQPNQDLAGDYKNVKVSETTPYKVFMNGKFSHTIDVVKGTEREICDYGIRNGVVCEPGYGGVCHYCSETCTLEEVRGFACGDGIVYHVQEQCDDGNTLNGDGCSSSCKKENVHTFAPTTTPVIGQQTPPTGLPQPTNTINQPIQQVTGTRIPLQQPLQQPVQQPAQEITQVPSGQIIEWETVEPSKVISNPLPQPNLGLLKPTHSLMPTEVEQPKQVLNTLSPKQEIQPVQPIQDTQPSIQAQQNPVVDVKSPQPKKPTLVVTNKPLPDVSPIESAKEVKPVVLEGPSVVQVEVTEGKALTLEATPAISTEMISAPQRQLTDIQMRQNIAMRTTTKKEGIGITTPYPERLSQTGADLKISSYHVFMLLLSGLLTCYFGLMLFVSNSLKIDSN